MKKISEIQYSIVQFRDGEFTVDFIDDKDQVLERIILNPSIFKDALNKSSKVLKKYEEVNGEIFMPVSEQKKFLHSLYNNLFYTKRKGKLNIVSGKKKK